ncbi:MAG: DHHA1 domain-containing protein, partial [Verrucomicrobia bacterium]|nr:DHHA1 domain-containing protein [Verrucomicrobiota bacterium]
TPTRFVGFDKLESPAKVLEVLGVKDKTAVILDASPLYAEMGGQVGDTGEMSGGGDLWTIVNTQKTGDAWLHFLADKDAPAAGTEVQLSVDRPRRAAIQRHHTVTHLLHWALHEVVNQDATQKGSYVGPEKLTFDFSSAPLTPQQVADVERLVNERILENAPITWTEAKHGDIKGRKDIMQFFGEKYGDVVRVVQIGGKAAALDGYSMELCGGTHARATGEIGLFRIVAESAIAAGIRRIEAVSGLEAYKRANEELQLSKAVAGKVNSPVGELEKKVESLLAQQKELEKQLKLMQQKQAAEIARGLAAKAQTIGSTLAIVENLGAADGDFLQSIADALKGQFKGVVVLGGAANNAVALVATVSPEHTKQIQAGKIIQTIAPIVGGKGGGRPDNARGGGKDVGKLDEALAKAKGLLG